MHSVASAVSLAAIPVTARAQPADQGWRGAAEGAQAAPADLRDADKSSLSTFASMALANRAVQAVAALLGLGDRLPHPGGGMATICSVLCFGRPEHPGANEGQHGIWSANELRRQLGALGLAQGARSRPEHDYVRRAGGRFDALFAAAQPPARPPVPQPASHPAANRLKGAASEERGLRDGSRRVFFRADG